MSASSVLFAALVLFGSAANGSKKFVQRLPNGGNIGGYRAIGHADGTGKKKATNDFGDAFHKAGNKWTVELCQADTDGDGQNNGQELGDPCCEWIVGRAYYRVIAAVHQGQEKKGCLSRRSSKNAVHQGHRLFDRDSSTNLVDIAEKFRLKVGQ
ncbi:hypothetical protein PF007_g19302 [Phytophthora fragariae]|nr:hypothetical protein PF007_g19302 [Phytophthora fragariae]KAE9170990.1 hypothetical protein PF004_g27699 [Phytophthora fragariae]